MSSEFKILFRKAIFFLIFLILFDLTIGHFTKELFYSQKTGKYARVTNSVYNDNSDLLIMGSSHAIHHYVPEILETELNMTCYNTGIRGQDLIFQTALLKMILKNNSPKLVILNIDPWWMYTSDEAYEKLAALYPYYWDYKEEIEPILSQKTKFINIKLLSNAYRTNSTIVHTVKYFLQPQKDYNGYIPLYSEMKKPEVSENIHIEREEIERPNREIESQFISSFEDFISTVENKNIDLVFIYSPMVYVVEPNEFNFESLQIMKSIADKHNVPLIDFKNNESFTEQYHLFSDPGHLNNDGALLFTKLVGEKVNEILLSKE